MQSRTVLLSSLALLLVAVVACASPTPTPVPTATLAPALTATLVPPTPTLIPTLAPSPAPTATATPLPLPTATAGLPEGLALTAMPTLTVRPTSSVQIESLSGDEGKVRGMLAHNLEEARSALQQRISEGCAVVFAYEVLTGPTGTMFVGTEERYVAAVRAVFTPDKEAGWRLKVRVQLSYGESNLDEAYESTFDPAHAAAMNYPEASWDAVLDPMGMIWLSGLPFVPALREDHARYPDPLDYFGTLLFVNRLSGDPYSYVGASQFQGRETIRYESLFTDSSHDNLFVIEFIRDNPLLYYLSTYQGPIGDELRLTEIWRVTEFGIESCS